METIDIMIGFVITGIIITLISLLIFYIHSRKSRSSGNTPGDKPGNKPGNKPGDKPGNKPGDKPGDHGNSPQNPIPPGNPIEPGDISDINVSTKPMALSGLKNYDGIAYLFWHVNNAMGTGLSKFPWDPNFKMKGKIKYFIVGIWPTWTTDNFNYIINKYGSQYKNCLASEQTATGGIEDAISLIILCQKYADSVGAQFVPFLLPPLKGWSNNIKTAGDVLTGIDGQLLIMKDIYNCPCQGVLIEGEEHYMKNIPEVNVETGKEITPSLMADHIFCAMRSSWSNDYIKSKNLKLVSDTLTIAWSEQGPMDSIKTYPSASTKWWYDFQGEGGKGNDNKTISSCEFTWPDSYEGNWTAPVGHPKLGHWKPPGLLQNCKDSDNKGGCKPLDKYKNKYRLFKETSDEPCCAGFAKGFTNDSIGRYCMPPGKYGSLTKNELFFPMDQLKQSIFTVGGPGSDLGIQYSGFGSENASLGGGPTCKKYSSTVLRDLYDNFSDTSNYGKFWNMKFGNSLAIYG